MIVRPMLGEWEVPRLSSIHSLEERVFVELPIPGRAGSLFQDLDRAPTRLHLQGSIHGEEARDDFLAEVRERFRAGEPVSFVADILTATDVTFVVIESLYFEESATSPDVLEYEIIIRESPPPPARSGLLDDLDLGLLEQAGGFLDSISGALEVIGSLGSIPELSDPTPPLRDALSSLSSAAAGIEGIAENLRAILGRES